MTHVLLPVLLLVRRADIAAVIGAGSGGEGDRGRAPADRCGAGPAGGDGAGLVAAFRQAGRGGPCGVHRVVPGAGGGSGAARAGGSAMGGCHRRGPRRCGGGGGPVLDRRGAGLAGRVSGVGGPVTGPGLAVGDRPGDQHELTLTPVAIFLVIIGVHRRDEPDGRDSRRCTADGGQR